MRPSNLLLLLLSLALVLPLAARHKAPKWTKKAMTTSPDGIRYRMKKPGEGALIKEKDAVRLFVYEYDYKTKKYDKQRGPAEPDGVNPKTGSYLTLEEGTACHPLIRSLKLMKAGGQGFFIVPQPGADSVCYFIKVLEVIPPMQVVTVPQDSVKTDTIDFHLPDPEQNRFGDTLFATLKLVEAPIPVRCNGIVPAMQAVKFRMTWFDGGVKHKDVLLYIECPPGFGENYWVAGASYVVTAIPLLENHKAGKSVQNSYASEKLESYYCLRIKKAGTPTDDR